jgi:hypothetical protein
LIDMNILSIPLSEHDMDDFVAWRHNKNGIFSVRSAYHMECESQFSRKLRWLDDVGSTTVNSVWAEVLKCKLPAKIKIFSRNYLHAILPCLGSLANHHINTSSSCPLCADSSENIKRTPFLCEAQERRLEEGGLMELNWEGMCNRLIWGWSTIFSHHR